MIVWCKEKGAKQGAIEKNGRLTANSLLAAHLSFLPSRPGRSVVGRRSVVSEQRSHFTPHTHTQREAELGAPNTESFSFFELALYAQSALGNVLTLLSLHTTHKAERQH